MRTHLLHKMLLVCLLLGILGGCASYQGAQVKPAEYHEYGMHVPGDCRVESVFKF